MKTKSQDPKPRTPDPKNKPTLVAFLLDRTGSMEQCKQETITGFNWYLKKLRDDSTADMRFTLIQFDSIGIDTIHDAVPLTAVNELNNKTYRPRSLTPLYDAIGRTIRATEKQAGDKYKVLFVTLTDGENNASSEWNCDTVKKLIKDKEDQDHWTFAYIGVGLEAFTTIQHMAMGTMSSSNVLRSSYEKTADHYARFAEVTAMYATSGQNVNCSAQNLWGKDKTTSGDTE